MRKASLIYIFLATSVITFFFFPIDSIAQNLESTNYILVAPSTEPVAGIIESPTYAALVDSSPINDFRSESTNYSLRGGTASNITPNVPIVQCFETNTNTGTCSIGSNGMQEVCGFPGCYDRAKLVIDNQSNPLDVRYAIQMSTTSDFSSNVFFVDATTRLLKTSLTINDFIFKCEWEGTTVVGYCVAPNTTWQRYNIIGLQPGTQYYLRVASLQGTTTNGSFTQSEWGPSVFATTSNTSISFDIDIVDDYVLGSSVAPHIINLPSMQAESVVTSSDYIVYRVSTNALGGTLVNIRGANGALVYSISDIPNVNGDLAVLVKGYGLRNISASNTSLYTGFIGSINIATTPSDFTESGPSDRVGSPTTNFVQIFNSDGLPLHTGRAAFVVKAKASIDIELGTYTETLTTVPISTF